MGGVLAVMALYLLLTGFEAEVYRLKWRGEPTTLEECRRYLNLPADNGLGELWRKAFDAVENAEAVAYHRPTYLGRGYDRLPFVGDGAVPNDPSGWYVELPIAIEFLKHFEKAQELADQVMATGQRLQFSTDYRDYNESWNEQLVRMMNLHGLLALQSLVLIGDRRFQEAVNAIERMGQLESMLASNPAVNSVLTLSRRQKRIGEILSLMLGQQDFDSSDLRRITASRLPFYPQKQLKDEFIFDRTFLIEYERNESFLTDPKRGLRFQFRTIELHHWTKMLELSQLDWNQWFQPSSDLLRQQRITTRERSFLLYAMLAEARQRLHLTAIASKIFTIEKGRVPDSIDQLVPEHLKQVPLFPATGDPMIMKENDQGELLFSYLVLPPEDLPNLEIPTFRYRVKPIEWTD